MKKRPYKLKQRAERQEETRARIVAAAAALHEELGASKTTISAIAERAGVQRLTVYRHFPDEQRLLVACSSHWLELHPPPDPAGWREIAHPGTRTRAAVVSLYGYYRRTEQMWRGAYRDEDEVPALKAVMRQPREYLRGVRDDLVEAWAPPAAARRAVGAIISHCLQFSTWESLDREPLTEAEMADAVALWVAALCEPDAEPRTGDQADRLIAAE